MLNGRHTVFSIDLADGAFIKNTVLFLGLLPLTPHLPHLHGFLSWTNCKYHLDWPISGDNNIGYILILTVPSGLKQLFTIGPLCAVTLTSRLSPGYECTVIEFVSVVFTGDVSLGGGGDNQEGPWVLSSSLEWGDHWRDVTDVLREIV